MDFSNGAPISEKLNLLFMKKKPFFIISLDKTMGGDFPMQKMGNRDRPVNSILKPPVFKEVSSPVKLLWPSDFST